MPDQSSADDIGCPSPVAPTPADSDLDALQMHMLMSHVLEHSGSATAVLDRDMRYIYVSRRFLDEYDVQDRNVIGKSHYEVFPDLPAEWKVVHQRSLAGEILNGEQEPYVHDDGTIHWTTWECRPWHQADNSIGGIILYTKVVNEHRHLEESIRRYKERLRALTVELMGAADREQRRIAVELHDGIGQLLAAAKIEADRLGARLTPDETSERLNRLLSEAITEVRMITAEIAPTVLVDRGLAESLQWLCDRYRRVYGLDATLTAATSSAGQDSSTDLLLFRVVRESLNNVVRHAQTETASVWLTVEPGLTTVQVRDHGVGFDSDAMERLTDSTGFGLFSLQEECALRGADFGLWSRPGKGTRVTVRVRS